MRSEKIFARMQKVLGFAQSRKYLKEAGPIRVTRNTNIEDNMSSELKEFRKTRVQEAKRIASEVSRELGVAITMSFRWITGTAVAAIDMDINNADAFRSQVAAMNLMVERGYSVGEMIPAPEFPTGMRYFQYFSI